MFFNENYYIFVNIITISYSLYNTLTRFGCEQVNIGIFMI
jgi:hypothetical protein